MNILERILLAILGTDLYDGLDGGTIDSNHVRQAEAKYGKDFKKNSRYIKDIERLKKRKIEELSKQYDENMK